MKKRIAFIFVVLALALAACGTKANAPSMDPRGLGGAPSVQSENLPAPDPMLDSYDTTAGYASNTVTQERLVIMNVDLSIVVPDPSIKMNAISTMASNLGGYIVSMNISQVYTQSGNTAPQGSISIRIPADKLDTALEQIKADAVDVPSENRTGQDVTSQYVDLQSQLTNLERAEQDLLAIMDQAQNNPGNDSTTKTQDVLNVYNQIVSIRAQIEQIKGQMKYYKDSSDYSLISVTLIAEETIKPIEIGGWKPQGVVRDSIQALIKFWQGFVNFLIWLVLLVLPILITIFGPIALVVWGIVVLVRRNKKKKAQAAK